MTSGEELPMTASLDRNAGSAPDGPVALADSLSSLDALREENEALGRELLRCYEQLSLVFEITEHIAGLQDPPSILATLLRRYGIMLNADAVFFDNGAAITAAEQIDAAGRLPVDPNTVRAALADEIASVRRSRRTHAPRISPQARERVGGAHVLLGALPQYDAETGVVITLRRSDEPAFDSGDQLAAESVLGYGGHILSNVLMVRQLQQTALQTVTALANAIDAKDNYTHGHSERVAWLARFLGRALGLPGSQLQTLEWAGLLHDVGKIGVSEAILNKPGKLTDAEFAEMKRHPRLSYEVLKPIASLAHVLDGVLHHHENHDGSGYPDGLRGEAIPLSARIIHVVDIFDALTSTRSYRKCFNVREAFEILRQDSGRVTDPFVTNAFLQAFERYLSEQAADFRQRFAHVVEEAPAAPSSPQPAASAGAEAGP